MYLSIELPVRMEAERDSWEAKMGRTTERTMKNLEGHLLPLDQISPVLEPTISDNKEPSGLYRGFFSEGGDST